MRCRYRPSPMRQSLCEKSRGSVNGRWNRLPHHFSHRLVSVGLPRRVCVFSLLLKSANGNQMSGRGWRGAHTRNRLPPAHTSAPPTEPRPSGRGRYIETGGSIAADVGEPPLEPTPRIRIQLTGRETAHPISAKSLDSRFSSAGLNNAGSAADVSPGWFAERSLPHRMIIFGLQSLFCWPCGAANYGGKPAFEPALPDLVPKPPP
jgi:hypothetical protein